MFSANDKNDKKKRGEVTDLTEAQSKADNDVSYNLRLRFGLSSIMHLTEQAVNRVISVYDRLFSLEDGNTARLYMGMGTDFAYGGNTDDALQALNKTLEMQPDNGEAWFVLGSVHLNRQAPEAAVEAFEKAMPLMENSIEFHSQLSEAFAELGNHEAAVKELKRVVELDPNSAESFFRLGVALDKLKDYEEAVKAFQKAIDLSPREPAYYQSLGLTKESLKEHEQAITCIKRAVELERRRSQ